MVLRSGGSDEKELKPGLLIFRSSDAEMKGEGGGGCEGDKISNESS